MSVRNAGIFDQHEWDRLVVELSLSRRQGEIAQLIFEGSGDKQIASDLKISIPSVRTHLKRMFKKLGVQGRNELVLHVVRHFLDSRPEQGRGD